MNRKLIAFAFALAPAMFAQLAAPNAAGVRMGHVHIKTRDIAAQRRLWIDVLGGTPTHLGAMQVAKFPGGLILYETGEPNGGTVGSTVNHLGFKTPKLHDLLARARKAEIAISEETATNAFLTGPEGVRVEVGEDTTLTEPIRMHHIHFFPSDVAGMKAWYVKVLEAKPGRRGSFEAADVPGINLTFGALDNAVGKAGTKGRVLDHIGFEVVGLEAFAKKLEASGIHFDEPYHAIPSAGVAIAYFTDPFGTYVELTEGLDKL